MRYNFTIKGRKVGFLYICLDRWIDGGHYTRTTRVVLRSSEQGLLFAPVSRLKTKCDHTLLLLLLHPGTTPTMSIKTISFLWLSSPYLALWGQNDVIIWPSDGAGELAEDDRFFGEWRVLLQAVVPVVHTHTHHLFWSQHRSHQPDVWALQNTLTGQQGSEEEEESTRTSECDYEGWSCLKRKTDEDVVERELQKWWIKSIGLFLLLAMATEGSIMFLGLSNSFAGPSDRRELVKERMSTQIKGWAGD